MKIVTMANEPKTGQERQLEVNLGSIQATASITLIDKKDKTVILKGETTQINIGGHFGMGDPAKEDPTEKAARERLIDGIDGLVAEYVQTINP